jgi:hypothetical protein
MEHKTRDNEVDGNRAEEKPRVLSKRYSQKRKGYARLEALYLGGIANIRNYTPQHQNTRAK